MSALPNHAILCARALSRPTFVALGRGEDPHRILTPLLRTLPQGSAKVSALLEAAFEYLRASYRNEYFYKNTVINKVVFGRHSPATSAVGTELHVGRSIIDLAVYNGTSTAYEIKSELDSPRRLTSQTTDYLRAFNKVYVVAPENSAERYAEFCNRRVGIIVLKNRGSLSVVRDAHSNLDLIDSRVIFRMLRRNEYKRALEHYLQESIDLPNGVVSKYCEDEFAKIPIGQAHQIYLDAMRARTTDTETVEFIRSLPPFLRALGYASGLSRPQRLNLEKALDFHLRLT